MLYAIFWPHISQGQKQVSSIAKKKKVHHTPKTTTSATHDKDSAYNIGVNAIKF